MEGHSITHSKIAKDSNISFGSLLISVFFLPDILTIQLEVTFCYPHGKKNYIAALLASVLYKERLTSFSISLISKTLAQNSFLKKSKHIAKNMRRRLSPILEVCEVLKHGHLFQNSCR